MEASPESSSRAQERSQRADQRLYNDLIGKSKAVFVESIMIVLFATGNSKTYQLAHMTDEGVNFLDLVYC